MQIPAAGFIEIAVDALPNEEAWITESKRKELHAAIGQHAESFTRGYLLGLKTGEIMTAALPPAPVPATGTV